MVAIANAAIKRTTRALIEWQLHTMTRPAEAATAQWVDIDIEKRIWTIPAVHIPAHRDRSFRLNVTACSGLS
jgi:integrase